MLSVRSETQRRLTFYVIPVLIGLGGVVYSQQLDSLFWRSIALIISVMLPLYTGGNLLSRYQTSMLERLVMLAGVLMLMLGAAYSVSGLSDSLVQSDYVSDSVINLSQVIGMLSLFLGLFVVLFSVIRTGEGIDEMADRFRFLAEHISEGFILSLPEGTIILVNQKVLDMFGMERESVIGRDARDLAATFGLNSIAKQLDTRAEGIASEYEVIWRIAGEDHVFLINGAPIFNKQGRHTLTMATVRDITEHRQLTQRVEQYARDLQKQVEEQTHKLHQSENRLRHLLLSMNEGFLTLDMGYRIRFVNDQVCSMLKSSREMLKGKEIFEFVDNVGRSRLLNLFAKAMEESPGKGLRQELEFNDSTGMVIQSLVGIAYLSNLEAANAGYSLVITPIGELKKMQQQMVFRARELERANEELRLHDRAKDSFLSNVTHELRTPLTTIQGYIEMFLSNSMGEVSETQRHALVVMERNARHLLNHINEMIEFSRMQIRGIQLTVNLYDAVALGHEAVAAILPSAADKGIKICTQAGEKSLYAWGDRDKLHQLLGIFLNNAVKFTPPDGEITLAVSCDDNNDVVFAVSDTGIGIDPVNHEKIFTRFFQVDSSKTRKYAGAGIGLSIAQNIVHAHGGAVEIESVLGQGSTFKVILPHSVLQWEVDEHVADSLNNLHVMIIEEIEERRKALTSFSPLDTCRVTFADNGHLAARKMNAEEPDIVIINDAPADIAGETTLRNIRQQCGIADVPVLILTSESGEVLQRELDPEANARFLFRPFTADALTKMMQGIVSGGAAMEANAIEELFKSSATRSLVIVIDSDPGFLEWVNAALRCFNIDAWCVSSPQGMFDSGMPLRAPDAVFMDADVPQRQMDDLLHLLRSNAATKNKPVYMLTSMGTLKYSHGDYKCAGVLHKPFPISDITDIIAKLDKK